MTHVNSGHLETKSDKKVEKREDENANNMGV
jgi:hypothetical protein